MALFASNCTVLAIQPHNFFLISANFLLLTDVDNIFNQYVDLSKHPDFAKYDAMHAYEGRSPELATYFRLTTRAEWFAFPLNSGLLQLPEAGGY